MTLNDIITNRLALFTASNNAGDGFDPDSDIEGKTPDHTAENTSDVSVYVVGDNAILVGDANGAWGVTVAIGE